MRITGVSILAVLMIAAVVSGRAGAGSVPRRAGEKIVGMYVHQHWPYNHPYCARTWTVADWRGYAQGLKQLGYNTILIWPMLETMPDPLTPSDEANLRKIGKVIDVLQNELSMRVYITLCPNNMAINEEARKAVFEKRHYYYCEEPINPGDPEAVRKMIAWRAKLLRPLRFADGFTIIDSDPGSYPGSTIAEFINLLGAHRKMLDALRPGIELVYWMHAGWRGWARLFENAKFELGRPEEYEETVQRLVKLNPEPWGMANGLPYAEKFGVADRVISFNYGRIEAEPSFPMTNFGGNNAYEGGSLPGPRGVMGNAQTHCAQLPNTFAFARGAQGKPVTNDDYVQFANDLIPGAGQTIVRGWTALSGNNAIEMRQAGELLRVLADRRIKSGPLKGLLFGSPKRFLTDLAMMLKLRASAEEFASASKGGRDVKDTFRSYVGAYEAWQKTHGFEGAMDIGRPALALRKLKHPAIEEVFANARYDLDPLPGRPNTNFEKIRAGFRHMETFSARLGAAMRQALDAMP